MSKRGVQYTVTDADECTEFYRSQNLITQEYDFPVVSGLYGVRCDVEEGGADAASYPEPFRWHSLDLMDKVAREHPDWL